MCLSPIQIKNPNYGQDPTQKLNFLKDCTSQYINVNCGTCPECVALNQMYLVQRIQMEALNNWLYMGTITYKNETLPNITTSQDYTYNYAEIKDYTDCIKRLRRNNSYGIPFRQIYVSERGGKGGRPHIHCLFIFKKSDIGKDFTDAQNFAIEHEWTLFNEWKRVTKKGRYSESIPLSDYRESFRYGIKHKTYDFHFVDARLTQSGITDVAFYVLKYMMKGSDHEKKIKSALNLNYEQEEAKATWDLIKSKQRHSLDFGLNVWKGEEDKHDYTIIEHLRAGIEESKRIKKPYPLYYCPEQIMTFPLSPYYKKNPLIYDVKDALDFYYMQDKPGATIDTLTYKDREFTQTIKKFNDYERKLKIIEQDVFSETLTELYE